MDKVSYFDYRTVIICKQLNFTILQDSSSVFGINKYQMDICESRGYEGAKHGKLIYFNHKAESDWHILSNLDKVYKN